MRSTIKSLLFNRWSAFIHDLLWIPVMLTLAYLLRFNLAGIPETHLDSLFHLATIGIFVQGIFFWVFGLYRGMWRFASIPDMIRILKAVFFGVLATEAVAFFASHLIGVPRSVLVLYPLLLVIGLCVPRLMYRWHRSSRFIIGAKDAQRVLIVGAGQAGEMLLRDMQHQKKFIPVGLIDDDKIKHGREIHGVRILGGGEEIAQLAKAYDVNEILIAIPEISKENMQRISHFCNATNLPVKILPALHELADRPVEYSQLRPFTVNDLLGRETVKLDTEAISSYLNGRNILVTGGGGSIGSELCRQVAQMLPSRLVVFEHSEFNLYAIEMELRENFPDLKMAFVLGDMKNQERVDWTFKTFSPDVVFHAAAYKHVPMIEINPAEGVQNNVMGSQVLADAAHRYGVERFVLVSTDKAVNPTNVMGTTKRIAEIYCQNLNDRSETQFITTRFGNVLASAGSVVPLFQKQIENGGPVTVTHPDITRYFMTIPESVRLILQAGSMGEGGEIFVLDMGEPIKISYLAEEMIRLSGLTPGLDIEIIYTGLRPGEKLYEEIFHESEALKPTSHSKLFLARSRQVEWVWLQNELEKLKSAATSRDIGILKEHLRYIVPEYTNGDQPIEQAVLFKNKKHSESMGVEEGEESYLPLNQEIITVAE